jgi:hypothetical protein
MTAPDKIKQLVETFEQNLNEYRTRKNETELRRNFPDCGQWLLFLHLSFSFVGNKLYAFKVF